MVNHIKAESHDVMLVDRTAIQSLNFRTLWCPPNASSDVWTRSVWTLFKLNVHLQMPCSQLVGFVLIVAVHPYMFIGSRIG